MQQEIGSRLVASAVSDILLLFHLIAVGNGLCVSISVFDVIRAECLDEQRQKSRGEDRVQGELKEA